MHRSGIAPTTPLRVLIAYVGLASCSVSEPSLTAPASILEFSAKFIVQEGFEGKIYLIHDPELGRSVEREGDLRVFRIGDLPCIRIMDHADIRLANMWLEAEDVRGKELYIRSVGYETSGDRMSIAAYWVGPKSSSQHDGSRTVRSAVDDLKRLGVRDLGRREATEKTSSADPKVLPLLPRHAKEGSNYPRMIVPDGYRGLVYLITDPVAGIDPVSLERADLYPFPSSMVLRIRMTEEMSARRSWPLVFEEGGIQLWLRPHQRTRGFDSLPIVSFLVCRSAEDIPDLEGLGDMTVIEQLQAKGIRKLKWPKREEEQAERSPCRD